MGAVSWRVKLALAAMAAAPALVLRAAGAQLPDPAALAALPAGRRRPLVAGLFLAAAVTVLAAAQPFAEALIGTGRALGIDEFLLVQWLAPLASEAPELLVATLFAWRGHGDKGVGTLLSAEVNQWTLLVGALPVAYLLGGGHGALPLDPRQHAEFVLTSAQAVLGFAVLANLRFAAWEAGAMPGLFAVQLALPSPTARLWLAVGYLLLAAVLLVGGRQQVPAIARTLLRRGAEHADRLPAPAPAPVPVIEPGGRPGRRRPGAPGP